MQYVKIDVYMLIAIFIVTATILVHIHIKTDDSKNGSCNGRTTIVIDIVNAILIVK